MKKFEITNKMDSNFFAIGSYYVTAKSTRTDSSDVNVKLRAKIKAKEYHIYLPYETTSKMKFHPGHIYMGGLLRQSEFTITHTSSSRVSDVMGTL